MRLDTCEPICLFSYLLICLSVSTSASLYTECLICSTIHLSCIPSSLRNVSDEVQAAAHRFHEELWDTYFGFGIHYAMNLSDFDLFKPWNSYLLTLGSSGFNKESRTFSNMQEFFFSNVTKIILLPSPGQEFPINITTRDQMLNKIAAAVTFQVRHSMRVVNFYRSVLSYAIEEKCNWHYHSMPRYHSLSTPSLPMFK